MKATDMLYSKRLHENQNTPVVFPGSIKPGHDINIMDAAGRCQLGRTLPTAADNGMLIHEVSKPAPVLCAIL
jgi:hypothetical protein